MTTGTICYAQQGPVFVLKFSGEIRYTMGCSLDDFLKKLFVRDDYDTILIDLTDTSSIDSTSLGLLAKIANFMRRRFERKPPLISTNADVNQVLDSMGFDEIFDICDDHNNHTEASKPVQVNDHSPSQFNQTLLDAHQTLCELNKKNQMTFKNVVEALENEANKDTAKDNG